MSSGHFMFIPRTGIRTLVNTQAVKTAKFAGSFVTNEGKTVFIKKVVGNPEKGYVKVWWSDDTSTEGRCNPGVPDKESKDDFNYEMGMLVAINKKLMGGKKFRELLQFYTPKDTQKVVLLKDVRKAYKQAGLV